MAIRVKLGGLSNNATEVDAKRQNYPLFKAAKHAALKGQALVDIAPPAKDAAQGGSASPTKVGKSVGGKPASFMKPKPVAASKAAVVATASDKKKTGSSD